MWISEGEWEEPWWGSGQSAAGWEQHLAELLSRALSGAPTTDPQPSREEVESVFRAVIASYEGD